MWTQPRADEHVGLTPGEEALWLLQRLAPDRGVSNVAIAMRVAQPLRWWPLQEAFRWLVTRHPPLRSRFPLRGAAPVRVAGDPGDVDVAVDLIDTSAEPLPLALRGYAAEPFDLGTGPPVRLGWAGSGTDDQVVCLVAHHLVIDPVSMDILINELDTGYAAFAGTGRPPRLPPPVPVEPPPPREESLRYWRDQLAGFDPAGMHLDPARQPSAPATFEADEIEWLIRPETAERVRALRARSRATEAAVLLAAYLVALRGLGAADDALVGVVVNTRGAAGANSVGYHAATLPLRVPVDPSGTLADLAATLTPRMWAAMEHSDVSFETVAQELVAGREDPDWWRAGLVRQLFNYHGMPIGASSGGPVNRKVWEVHTGLARFDLELTVIEQRTHHLIRLSYSTQVHDAAFALQLLERIETVLEQGCADPDRTVRDIDVRTADEHALQRRVNDTAVGWSPPHPLPSLVLAAAAAHPDAVAVVDGAGRVGYPALVELAGRVRTALDGHGVRPGDVVAVATPRGARLAAAVLGVWFAGAAYLPVDPDQPGPWLGRQLADAGVRVALDGHLLPDGGGAGLVCVPVPDPGDPYPPGDALPPVPVDPDALAYLIYTSGSTGRPKGVRITHRNLSNVVRHFTAALGADPTTRMLWLTTFAFDISVLELALPLSCGGTVVTGADEVRSVPGRLAELVQRERVDIVQATPTTWRAVLGAGAGWLAGRTVLCGGEPLPPVLATRFREAGCRAMNVYGPTETTVWSTTADLAEEDPDRLTVGRPIANTAAHVLDPAGRPRPVLVTGELCLAGDGVAQGYHGQPELTAQRFPTDPVLGRYYRTGDLARMLPDGRIELLGRRDRQIKLRGHRIELDEVEAVLAEHPEVRAAAVVLRGEPDGDGYLAAFVVADDRPGLPEDIWSFARGRLPSHRLPGRVLPLRRLPQTPNGKVDLVALATRDLPAGTPGAAAAIPGAAATEPVGDVLEQRLLDTWREVLGSPDLDRHANFFLSGGTSLRAAVLAEQVSRWHAAPVPMMMVFQAPTPAALAALLRGPGGG